MTARFEARAASRGPALARGCRRGSRRVRALLRRRKLPPPPPSDVSRTELSFCSASFFTLFLLRQSEFDVEGPNLKKNSLDSK